MFFRRRKVPGLRSRLRPDTLARALKKNGLEITPFSASRSAISPTPAPRGITTRTCPSPSPPKGCNRDTSSQRRISPITLAATTGMTQRLLRAAVVPRSPSVGPRRYGGGIGGGRGDIRGGLGGG